MVTWDVAPLDRLGPVEVHELLRLRVDVFVVEQACAYPELDDHDVAPGVEHLRALRDGVLVACARLLPPGTTHAGASIGRVAVATPDRGTGLGHELVGRALARLAAHHPVAPVEIGAQAHLRGWYERHGFATDGDEYVEDGIPHVHMRRPPVPDRA